MELKTGCLVKEKAGKSYYPPYVYWGKGKKQGEIIVRRIRANGLHAVGKSVNPDDYEPVKMSWLSIWIRRIISNLIDRAYHEIERMELS